MRRRPAEQTAKQRVIRFTATLGLILGFAFALTACGKSAAPAPAQSGAASASASATTQTREGGQVTIAVTWQGPTTGITFRVAMDTHAVNLDGYDLTQLATLRTDQGVTVQPSGWDAPKGGHHREGTLTFPATTLNSAATLGPATRMVELIIRDVAGVPERRFTWTL